MNKVICMLLVIGMIFCAVPSVGMAGEKAKASYVLSMNDKHPSNKGKKIIAVALTIIVGGIATAFIATEGTIDHQSHPRHVNNP